MARGVDLDMSDLWDWYYSVPLQLYTGNLDAYRRLCHTGLKLLADTKAPELAERVAKVCLLEPDSVEDRQLLSRLADRSIKRGAKNNLLPWFELAKGMAEYRADRFQSAVDWLQKSSRYSEHGKDLLSQTFLAMAYHRLGQSERARQAMDQAHRLREPWPPPAERSVPAGGFHDWIIAEITYREADQLLNAPDRREAEEFIAKRQWSEAVRHLDHLTKSDKSFWADWVSRSCALAELDRQTDAEADFARAAARLPSDAAPLAETWAISREPGPARQGVRGFRCAALC